MDLACLSSLPASRVRDTWSVRHLHRDHSQPRQCPECLLLVGRCGRAWFDVSRGLWPSNSQSMAGIYLAIALAMLGFLAVFLLSSRIATLAENHLDFPAANTRGFSGFLLINRAYRTHGKGQSWNIQTMPIWSNLDITPSDYGFMLKHRRPGDPGRDADEISSRGFFCAHVLMQQSGNAVRVLNAGSRKLPSGTVVICPASSTSLLP